MGVSSAVIRKYVKNNLRYKMRRGQFMTKKTMDTRLEKAKKMMNKLKNMNHGKKRAKLIFFSDEKNFTQDQKINRQNDRWLCSDPRNIPVVMSTKFPTAVMVLGVISNEGHIMPPHFFEKGLSLQKLEA